MSLDPLLLDLLRTALAAAMLGYGSYRDIRTREIHDMLWVVSGGAGLVLDAYEMLLGTLSLRSLLFSVGFMVAVGLALGYLRLFGAADLLAFVALAVIHPRAPVYLAQNWGWSPPFFPFTLVSNAAIAGAATPLLCLARNLGAAAGGVDLFERHRGLSQLRRAALLLTSVSVETSRVKGPPFQYPLEDPGGDVRLRPDIWDDDEAARVFRLLREGGAERVWVSATLPYLVVISLGYALSVAFGDVLLWLFLVVL